VSEAEPDTAPAFPVAHAEHAEPAPSSRTTVWAVLLASVALAVAVPAVVLYNLLGRRNKVLSDKARHFAIDVEKLMATSTKG